MASQLTGDRQSIALLVNKAARHNQAGNDTGRVISTLRSRGVEPLVLDSSSAETAWMAVRKAVDMQVSRLLVFGGDGTVHLAAAALADSGIVLGVVAGGTGNDLAQALGLNNGTLDSCVDRALGEPVPIDLIVRSNLHGGGVPVENRYAVTSCVAGFPAVVNVRAEAMRFPKGPSRYTMATLLAIGGMRPGHFRLTCRGGPDDGKTFDERAAVLVIANTGLFGGGMRICPEAQPNNGLLDVCLVGEIGRISLLKAFPKVRTGAHLDHPAVRTLRAAEIDVEAIDADPLLRADGEPFGSLPCTFAVRPGSLNIAGALTEPPGRI